MSDIDIIAVATVFTLPETRALAEAVAEHHPEADVTAVVLGGHGGKEPFRVLDAKDIGIPRWRELIQDESVSDLVAIVRPAALRHLVRERRRPAVLLDPHVLLERPLAPVLERLAERPVVLTPRVLEPLPVDDLTPTATDLARHGEIDPCCVAAAPDEAAYELLDWWVDTGSGLAAARTAFGDRVALLDDPGCNVSAWNLHARLLQRGGRGLTAGGAPVTFLNLEGFRADRPYWLADAWSRVRVIGNQALAELCERRAERLLAHGWRPPRGVEHTREKLPDGTPYSGFMRSLHDWALASGVDVGDLAELASLERLYAWLREPAPEAPAVNRALYAVYRKRGDVAEAYPDLGGHDAAAFVDWAWTNGRDEDGIPEALLPPRDGEPPAPPRRVPAVEALGYLNSHLGLGKAAREYVDALRAANVPVSTRSIRIMMHDAASGEITEREAEQSYAHGDDALEPEVSLLCANPDELLGFVRAHGPAVPADRHRIGVWGWEADVVPARWAPAFDHVDEVWTYSHYTADILAAVAPVPVLPMPLPVTPPDPRGVDPPDGLPDGFLFLFTFDFFSTIERKNPVGLIEAFKRAFAPGEGPTLVLKSLYADRRPRPADEVRHAIGDRPDILLLDVSLDADQQAALLARADCFVSLHRSEGWGLGLAESMAIGKPVIATRFSGNLDFMDERTGFLVDCTQRRVGPEVEIYPAEARWAEPDLDHAAQLMRLVHDEPARALEVGERARRHMRERFSHAVVGRRMADRLERLARGADGSEERGQDADLDELLARAEAAGADAAAADRPRRRDLAEGQARAAEHLQALTAGLVEALRATRADLRTERAIARRARALAAGVERRLYEAEDRVRLAQRERETLDRRLQDLDRLIASELGELRRLSEGSRAVPFAQDGPESFDHPIAGRVLGYREPHPAQAGDVYRRFEDVFRGSSGRVRELHEAYVPLVRDHQPVLELGCGRGEFLALLGEHGIDATGVDPDEGMLRAARERRVANVERTDALSALSARPDASLGTVFSAQVVEHIPHAELHEIVALARRKLRPGGLFIAETVNPHAAHALKTFWVDLTHQHPVFPEVALELARIAGFSEAFVFHPTGSGDVDADRFVQSSYALVATA